jgi:tripartite-type tricarboxylate transporter receptor subunit TctC
MKKGEKKLHDMKANLLDTYYLAKSSGDLSGAQDIKDKMEAQGAEPVGNNPEEFRAFVRSEIDKWEQVIVKSGAKID